MIKILTDSNQTKYSTQQPEAKHCTAGAGSVYWLSNYFDHKQFSTQTVT